MKSRSRCLIFLCIGLATFVASAMAQTISDYDTLVQKGKTQLQAGSADLALASGEAAIKMNADRWEGYALAGGALMNLKRYEEAADKLSEAIKRAPEAKQAALRDLRRQCLMAESGVAPAEKKDTAPSTTSQAEIVLWKSIENSTNPADFQSYLDQYPHGAFVVLAQRHLAEAKAQQQKLREQAEPTWTDPSTGLMWTKSDNGTTVKWNQASNYCQNLKLAGYSNWRLPTIEELAGIHDPSQNVNGYHIKGGIRLTGCCTWSNTAGNASGKIVLWKSIENSTNPADFERYLKQYPHGAFVARALCVRRSGE